MPAFFGGAFYIFLLRQFFATIPTELDDAAKIDGCGYIGIWWRILLPLCKPALVTVSVFSFMAGWNDFLWPLIILNDAELVQPVAWPGDVPRPVQHAVGLLDGRLGRRAAAAA